MTSSGSESSTEGDEADRSSVKRGVTRSDRLTSGEKEILRRSSTLAGSEGTGDDATAANVTSAAEVVGQVSGIQFTVAGAVSRGDKKKRDEANTDVAVVGEGYPQVRSVARQNNSMERCKKAEQLETHRERG